jgi:hypothetical protein
MWENSVNRGYLEGCVELLIITAAGQYLKSQLSRGRTSDFAEVDEGLDLGGTR